MSELNVYCDESCHLENDHQKVMVLGAVTCPRDKAREIAVRLRELVGEIDGVDIVGDAGTPADAIDAILRTHPQCVLLDYQLEGGTGVDVLRAVHPSFGDQCEVPEVLRGVSAACEPEVLPWRHVRHIESYLALNFFDAALGGSAEALARLDPAALADVEDLVYQRK